MNGAADGDVFTYPEVQLQLTPVDVIVQDKTKTLYATSSGFCWDEITYLTFSSLLIYLYM